MKKTFITTATLCCVGFAGCAFADSMPYEPVFENVPITESITSAIKEQPTQSTMTAVPKISAAQTTTPAVNTVANTVENGNLQSALMQLDSAQVEIRNQLIQYKNDYAQLDAQYKTLKEQRSAKAKQVKDAEKKIKNLEGTKEKIRKNME